MTETAESRKLFSCFIYRGCRFLCLYFRKFSQPLLDPTFAVVRSFTEQECAAHAARHAVIPTGHRRID
jgi:hypothetical protein